MNFEKCKTCGKYDFVMQHRCPPLWECEDVDGRYDPWAIYAYSEESAAADYVERCDDDGGPPTEKMNVKVTRGGISKIFLVTSDIQVQYEAEEIEE